MQNNYDACPTKDVTYHVILFLYIVNKYLCHNMCLYYHVNKKNVCVCVRAYVSVCNLGKSVWGESAGDR